MVLLTAEGLFAIMASRPRRARSPSRSRERERASNGRRIDLRVMSLRDDRRVEDRDSTDGRPVRRFQRNYTPRN